MTNGGELQMNFSNLHNFNNTSVAAQYSPVPFDPPELPLTLAVGFLLVSVVVFVVGVVGNILVFLVILRNPDMRHSMHLGLVSLSLADILVLVVCMPTALAEFYGKDVWYFGRFTCKLIPFLENTAAHASALTICAISIERYYAIRWPLKARIIRTNRGAAKIVGILWLLAALSTLPMILITLYQYADFYDGSQVPVCRTHVTLPWQQAYIFSLTALFYAIPCVLLVAVYISLGYKLFMQTMAQSKISNGNVSGVLSLRLRKRIILMLFIVTAMFFICLLPFKVMSIWHIYATAEAFHRLGFTSYTYIMAFARSMYYLNSAINPVVYSLVSMRFRGYFRRAISCRERKQQSTRGTCATPTQTHVMLRRPQQSSSNSKKARMVETKITKCRDLKLNILEKEERYS